MFKSFITLLLFFSSGNYASGQSGTTSLSAAQYKEDFTFLRTALEKNYPSLYRFRDKENMHRFLDSCYHSLNQETDDVKFYAVVKNVLSYIGDGHLSSGPSAKLRTLFQEQWQSFPLSLVFLGDKVYNLCENISIPKGSEIISVNNRSMQSIRQQLLGYIVSDGKIESGKNYLLNNAFWFYYNLVYGLEQNFNIRYRTLNREIKNTTMPAVLRKDIQCDISNIGKNEPLLQFSYPQKNTALITIKTFSHSSLTQSKEDFGVFLDSAFRDIKKKHITKLIIDLRGNGGGADVYGSYLYSFLADKDFKYYSTLETSEKVLAASDHPNLSIQKPVEDPYKGKVFVLINGLSFSATAEFCSIAKSNNRAIFIGEETGGTYYGNTSGNFVETILPNTQITVSLPTTRYTMAVKEVKDKDRGIIPDHMVIPTIMDIIKNRDVQLNYAIKLAEKE